MRFDYRKSDKVKALEAMRDQVMTREACEMMESMGLFKDSIILHNGRKYTNLRVNYHSSYPRIYGDFVKKDGGFGSTNEIWNDFEILPQEQSQ